MSYEILRTVNGLSILHITAADLNSFSGWRIEFDNGKEAMLYHNNFEWMQFDKQWLDEITLIAIGNCIDMSLLKKTSGINESSFYNFLVN